MNSYMAIIRMLKLVKILNFCLFEGYLYRVKSFSKTKFDYEITDARTSLF